ncbi:MAG: c-type cytochrome [Gammaproteobacteria bacterium]|nr:c-type cytochrome [Gammaproteobacteria bacterium]
MRASLSLILVVLGMVATCNCYAEGDPASGRQKAFTCMGCHAAPGMRNAYPAYPVPKLGGQNAAYLVEALKAYKSGARNHSTMHAHAATMSDQDMEDIAAYFSGLTKP